jgi:hypothetical protein
LRHLLPAPPAKELLLGGVAVPERHREAQALQFRQVAEDRAGAHLQAIGQVGRPNPRPGGGDREDHQQTTQALGAVHGLTLSPV